jgi:copper transport protein
MWSCGEHAWRRRAAALAGGFLLCLIVLAPPASAHAVLVGSDPPDGATLARAPRSVQLQFSEDVAARFSSARLVDRSGRPVGGASVAAARGGSRLLVLQLPALAPGAYGVLWQVLADADGHTTSGAVVFNVGERSGSALQRSALGGGEAIARPADVARRWVGVCLLAALIGALAVAGLVLGRPGSAHPAGPLAAAIGTARRRLLALGAGCAALGLAAGAADAAAKVAGQAPVSGGWWGTVGQLLAATRWGRLWLVREGVLLALVLVTLRWRSRTLEPRGRGAGVPAAAAGVLVLALVSVEAMGSHAAALQEARAPAIAAGALHVLTACVWLGTLPALLLMMWPQRWGAAGPADLLAASRGRLTALAASSAGLVLVTGLYSAGRQVGTVDGLPATPYGRALLAKSALLLVLGGLGLVNSARLHGRCPAWLGAVGRRLTAGWPSCRLVLAEAGAGALLLLAVGVLLETAPAHGPATRQGPATRAAATPGAAQTASGSVADLVVTVSATPNRPGVNGFTALAGSSRRPPPAPLEGVELRIGAARGGGVVALQQVGPGRWFGTGRLDQAGPLRLEAVLHRAGKRLAVPLSWWVGPPAPAPGVAAAPGRRLAPYVDGMALSLLAAALAATVARLVLARRRRRAAQAVRPAETPERVLEEMR